MALTSSQIASRLFKQSLTTTETSTLLGYNEEPISSRLSVFPSQIWAQSDQIPSTAEPSLKLNALTTGTSYSVGVVKYFRKHTLKTFSGISNKNISFWSEDLIDSIPLNFDPSGASYVFELFKSDGTTPINFGNGDWLVDTNAGVLTFYGTTSPAGIVSSSNPPKISFYKYIGPKGLGVDSGIGTILGVTAGVGLTGGGTAGYITLDVNVGNGLEVSSDTIYLGGTLSQNTNIELMSNVFTIEQGGGLNQFYFDSGQITLTKNDGFGTSSNINFIDGLTNWSFIVSGSESSIYLSQGALSTDGTVNTMLVRDTLSKKGLVYADDYTGNFTTHSLVTKGYVDSAVPNVGVGNGLQELSPVVVGLGGTLSQNTTISGESFDLTIQDFDVLTLTGSVVDIQLDNGIFLVDVTSGGSIDLYGGDVTINATGSIDLTSTDEFTVSTGKGYITTSDLEGLVYTSDYSGTFVTNSLVTKGYVDSSIPNVGATNGIIEYSPGVIGLGGTLSQNTLINGQGFSLTIGDLDNIIFTGSVVDVELDNGLFLVDAGDTGSVDLYAGDVLIYGSSSITITSLDEIEISAASASITTSNLTITNLDEIEISTASASITTSNLRGLEYSTDYSGTFVTNSLVSKSYVDSGTSSIWSVINTFSSGLTPSNGLDEFSTGYIGLGGTLSVSTFINADNFDLTIGNVDSLTITASIIDFQLDNGSVFIDSGDNGSVDIYAGGILIYATSSVDIATSGEFTITTTTGSVTTTNLEGLVYTSDYSGTFVTNSLVTKGYVDSAVPNVGATNGLSEITPGVVGLGGTLSLPTVINGDVFDLTIGNIDTLLFTSSIFDVESDFISLDAGTGSMQLLADGDIDVMSVGEISLGGASGKVTTSNNQGLVYTSDYTSTFVTHSLVTKGYVDSIASSIGADNGLTEFLPGTVSLGGSLSQNTLIGVNGNTFSFLDNTGTFSSFFTMATNSLYGKTIEMGLTEDLTNSASSSYISFNVDNGTILQDYNKQVQIATTVPFGTYLFKITAASQSIGDGSTDNHMIIDDYGSKGLVYQGDYTPNFTQNSLVTKSFVVNYINTTHFSQDFSVPSNTSGDGASTFQSILYTPFDASSVQVFVNGLLQRLGDGVTASVDCYFSADGGLTPLSIDGVSSGDILYWNGLTSRFDLETDDFISIVYQYKP